MAASERATRVTASVLRVTGVVAKATLASADCPRGLCSKEAHRVDDPLVESTESHVSTTFAPANRCGSGLNALNLSSLSILQRIIAQMQFALTSTLVVSWELMHMTAW